MISVTQKGGEMNATIQKENRVELPAGFTARGASLADAELAMALFNRWSNAVIGRDDFKGPESIRNGWDAPGVDPAQDVRLVFAPNGELAGYGQVWMTGNPPAHPEIWGRVDPQYEGMGIGTWLMHWEEQRASQARSRVPAEMRFAFRTGIYRQSDRAKSMFENMGYRHVRSLYHMLIEMDAPAPEPQFPAGITVRTYNPGTDLEPVYRANTEAFRDHFGFVEKPFEEGLREFQHHWEQGNVDPSVMFIAMDGSSGEIAAVNLCRPTSYYDAERGWVSSLGVRRPWRHRGLGLALLRHAFNEFYRRGKHKVGLGVDAENLTGALRLYENAGMRVDQAYDRYEKEVRPGKEISVQSLS
jgi:mycothiol synthase